MIHPHNRTGAYTRPRTRDRPSPVWLNFWWKTFVSCHVVNFWPPCMHMMQLGGRSRASNSSWLTRHQVMVHCDTVRPATRDQRQSTETHDHGRTAQGQYRAGIESTDLPKWRIILSQNLFHFRHKYHIGGCEVSLSERSARMFASFK